MVRLIIKSGFLLITIMFLLVSALLVTADTEITLDEACLILSVNEYTCSTYEIKELCWSLFQLEPETYYFDEANTSCYSVGTTSDGAIEDVTDSINNVTVTTATSIVTTDIYNTLITDLTQRVNNLEIDITTLQNSADEMVLRQGEYNSQFSAITSKLEGVNTELKNIENSFEEGVASFSTGLVGLQTNLNETENAVVMIEENLAREQSFTKFLKTVFFVLLTLIITLGLIFFVNRSSNKSSSSGKLSAEISNYITRMIKSGKKYSVIKQHLTNAGWLEEDIKWAYKETIKKNYYKYKGGSDNVSKGSKSKSSLGPDKNKILTILGVIVLLIFGVLFLLKGTNVGQAFQIMYDTQDLEIVGFNCTEEHILNEEGDGCCLDVDPVNQVCDYLDKFQDEEGGLLGSALETGLCTNNQDCNLEEICLDQRCQTVLEQYETEDCTSNCLLSKVKVFTSDGDTFDLVPGQGSYTAAGAIEWKILPTPLFCSGQEELPVLFKITKKVPTGLLSEQVISLQEHQTSTVIIHQKIPKLAFTLKVEDIKTSCGI